MTSSTLTIPDLPAIQAAASRIAPYIHLTPVLSSATFNAMTGASLYFKCENLQKVGAFKARGATNAVLQLSAEEAGKGVATHSSGNHAQALALAARNRGIPAYIVMPSNSPAVKVNGVKDYGGEVIFCEPNLEARETTLQKVVADTGATFIHPYNDYRIICGQGTAALEFLDEVPDLDILMAPVGGGGLLSGTALTTHYLSPKTKVIAAEPEGAPDAHASFIQGQHIPVHQPNTIADGLKTSLGPLNFDIIQQHVADIVLVDDAAIIRAMKLIWERMKIVVEPSAAVPFAAILENKVDVKGKKVGIIFSGGNVDLDQLPWNH